MKTLAYLGVALSLSLSAAFAGDAGYVAHEWGTFTSVQGADGVQMQWNPLNVLELPGFVYNLTKLASRGPLDLAKTAFYARQRLETPVIYFHSAEPRVVDVAVRFPDGNVTEWFPRAELPSRNLLGEQRNKAPAIQWTGVSILPRSESAKLKSALPSDAGGSHYYAAREADADFVRIARKGAAPEVEKYLFYRGVGQFDAPLQVSLPSADETRITLKNSGTEALRDLFLVQVRDHTMAITTIPEVGPGETGQATISSPVPLAAGRAQLAKQMRAALVAAGLYESEAAAMVKTWDDSWFAESGLRILYVLPVKWADSVLPLEIKPAPRETVRAFVGRAEVITPTMEHVLAAEVTRYSSDPALAIANTRALGLGRFLEPAFRRLVAQHPQDREFSTIGWELLHAANRPEPTPKLTSSR